MTTTTATGRTVATSGAVRNGATLMAVAAAGFIGYAGLFLVRNFTNSFLELGIGPKEVDVQADTAGDRRPARRWRDSTASCCCQHNTYQRAQVSWTTSSASEPRQPARPTPNSKYEPLIRPATCSRSKQICGDDHPCITRYGVFLGRPAASCLSFDAGIA
jgi:hypothetical protein